MTDPFDLVKDDHAATDDARVAHPNAHNDIAIRVNYAQTRMDAQSAGVPNGGQPGNVVRVSDPNVYPQVTFTGAQAVTPGGQKNMVQALINKSPFQWDWRVPDSAGAYPSARRKVNPDDPESDWLDSEDFGTFQGWWIVDPNDPLGNNQWGQNGDLWLVYDREEEPEPEDV